jgi:hypothetical protein
MAHATPDQAHAQVIEQLLNRNWGELEILEQDGRLHFHDKIYQRQADGEFVGKDVLLVVPRGPDHRWARLESRRLALEMDPPLDLDRDKDLVSNLEDMCLLSRCMRDPKQPSEPYDPFPLELENHYEHKSLEQIYEKLDRLTLAIDPRPENVTEDEILGVITAIVKERNILPLAVLGQGVQNICIVYMADQLAISLGLKSSSDSSGESTPEP